MRKTALLVAFSFVAIGCAVDGRQPNVGVGVSVGGSPPPPVVAATPAPSGGPPPWAPAHGRRAKGGMQQYYYPSTGVYFNVSTGSYFYLNGGAWQMSMALPSTVTIDASNYVSLDLDTDRPYMYYE